MKKTLVGIPLLLAPLLAIFFLLPYLDKHPAIRPLTAAATANDNTIDPVTTLLILSMVATPFVIYRYRTYLSPTNVAYSLWFGLWLSLLAWTGKDCANVYYDHSAGSRVMASVIDKRKPQSLGRNSRQSYYLQVTPEGESARYELHVPQRHYEAATRGQRIAYTVHPGYFGQPWVSDYSTSTSR